MCSHTDIYEHVVFFKALAATATAAEVAQSFPTLRPLSRQSTGVGSLRAASPGRLTLKNK